jgi:hypothetical protein
VGVAVKVGLGVDVGWGVFVINATGMGVTVAWLIAVSTLVGVGWLPASDLTKSAPAPHATNTNPAPAAQIQPGTLRLGTGTGATEGVTDIGLVSATEGAAGGSASTTCPANALSKSFINAHTVEYRSPGSLANALFNTVWTLAGKSGRVSPMDGGGSCTILYNKASVLSARKGT